MSTGTTTNQQTSGTSSPWAPQQPYIQNAFSGAQGALNTAQSTGVAPTQFTAGLTPAQQQTYAAMVGTGLGSSAVPGQEASTGSTLANVGTNATTGALSSLGGFNAANTNNMNATIAGGNQYAAGENIPAQVQAAMLSANEEANNVTLPGIDSAAAGSGNTNSSRTGVADGIVQQGLSQQAGALSAQLQAGAYNTGAGLASSQNTANNQANLNAYGTLGSLGNSATGTGIGALGSSITDQGNLYNMAATGGAGQQAGNQATDTNQQQAYDFSQNSPFTALNNYLGLVGGNYGSSTTGTQSGTSTPSIYSLLAGLGGTAGSLLGTQGANVLNPAASATGGFLKSLFGGSS